MLDKVLKSFGGFVDGLLKDDWHVKAIIILSVIFVVFILKNI